MKFQNIREEELKNNIAQDFFWLFDCKKVIGNVDFCVCLPQSNKGINPLVETQSLLWAEAKRGSSDIYKSLTQLILTIGKARTFDKHLPPTFLGAFDFEKIAFIPYNEIQALFYLNDFNWNVAPSNFESREFKMIHEKLVRQDNSPPFMEGWTPKAGGVIIFNYLTDEDELKRFIKINFADKNFGLTKIKIDKNNFLNIYYKWLETVKPTIQVNDWNGAKNAGIIDGYFYLADLLSQENKTLKDKLYVILQSDHYVLDRKINQIGFPELMYVGFSDNQKAHSQFWAKYERPPLEEYWNYIIERQDLLVPQDVRERKGSFFTPRIWVELSQKYLADVLGEDWQEEYYVWDCCAGTGNLLAGLTNKYNIWASTLDKADVEIMKDRIENGANLLESHVFQFDFLNDDFSKLPQGLQEIIHDDKKRKKLVIYINPPYAEATSTATRVGTRENKTGVATGNKTHIKYANKMGKARNELFAQFLTRIYFEIPGCKIGEFSKIKVLNSPNFIEFRKFFMVKFLKGFIIPADTFDNVKGKFPIGFFIWNTSIKEIFKEITTDIFDYFGHHAGLKRIVIINDIPSINKWIKNFSNNKSLTIGYLPNPAPDFQNNNFLFLTSYKGKRHVYYIPINNENLIVACIYFTVRKVISSTWLNDRDQFLYPNDGWKTDLEFQNDCLAYTLFNNSNNISSKCGTNHWIPFTEYVAHARDKFKSNFMTDFINGTIVEPEANEPLLFYADTEYGGGGGVGVENFRPTPREFSETAKKVFKAGGDIWRYYHTQQFPSIHEGVDAEGGRGGYNVNASLYDIREHFQGRNEKGNMNAKSKDEKYNELVEKLRATLKMLANKIEPKVYEYGFLIK